MKNLERTLKKTCLFMDCYDFMKLVKRLTGWEVDCTTDYGIELDAEELDEAFDGDVAAFEAELKEALGDYFGTTVTSVHTDNCEDCPGVWIVYVEEHTRARNADR